MANRWLVLAIGLAMCGAAGAQRDMALEAGLA